MSKKTVSSKDRLLPDGWIKTTIGECAPLQRGFDLPSNNRIDGDYPVVYSNGIVNYHNTYKVLGSGVITGRSGTLGKVHYVDGHFWPHNTTLWVTQFKNCLPKFIYYLFKQVKFERFGGGSGVPTLNRNDAHEYEISIPSSIDEQQKIAQALTDADNYISALEKLIEKKKMMKEGLMVNLLTGKQRLKEFAFNEDGTAKGYKDSELGKIPEDWEIFNIGDLLSVTTGDKNTQDKVSDGSYPFFVRSQIVETSNTYSFDGEGVLTAGDGVGTGKIFHYINGKCDIHQRVYLMSNFNKQLHGYFFYLYFSRNFYNRIMSMTAKSSVDSVRKEMIADMKIYLPILEEQIEISKLIQNSTAELNNLEQKLSKFKKIKQGMMQKLLTGEIRLA